MSATAELEGRVSEMLMRVRIMEDALFDPTGWELAAPGEERRPVDVEVLYDHVIVPVLTSERFGIRFGPIDFGEDRHDGLELWHNGELVYVHPHSVGRSTTLSFLI